MDRLIKNEFFKLKRERFVLFLALLSFLPVLTGGAGAFFNGGAQNIHDLFFFMNNQYAMFFPMVIFILVGSLFYQEYKNKTYLIWITYGHPKSKLFFSKIAVALLVGLALAALLFLFFGVVLVVLQAANKVEGALDTYAPLALGFFFETLIVVPVTACLGAILINLSRNIIVTSVVGVIYGFISCFFIGAEGGYLVPGGFAYRVGMFFSDPATYYDFPRRATIGGCASAIIVFLALLLAGLRIFTHRREIEN